MEVFHEKESKIYSKIRIRLNEMVEVLLMCTVFDCGSSSAKKLKNYLEHLAIYLAETLTSQITRSTFYRFEQQSNVILLYLKNQGLK